jgi:hypothetical protein
MKVSVAMEMRSLIKLLTFWILIASLSCVHVPTTTELVAVHYGDSQDLITKKAGPGFSIIYFSHNGIDYHYRTYLIYWTGRKYALLFANGKLVAFTENVNLFDECLVLDEKVGWASCLARATQNAEAQGTSLLSVHDFSNELETEQHEKNYSTAISSVMIPVAVVLWPISVMYVGCSAPELKEELVCIKSMPEVYETATSFDSTDSYESIVTALTHLHTELASALSEKSINERHIIGRKWSCRDYRVNVLFAFSNERLVWSRIERRSPNADLPPPGT